VRYAKNITLVVTLDEDRSYNEMIYTPYLEINYGEKSSALLLLDSSEKMTQVSFSAEYKMETTGFWKLCKWLFWILLVIMVLMILISTSVYTSKEN
jgi:hypothetical protein